MNKVHLCNCMDFMKSLPDKAYSLAIVDPPYSCNSGNAFKSRLKKYGSLEFNEKKPEKQYFKELFRISENQIIWGGNYFIENLHNTKCLITWWKHQPVQTYATAEVAWTSFHLHCNIFDYQYFGNINSDTVRIHPNQKPIALYRWLLNNYAKPGDTIFDSHVGSGSIRIACDELGFDFEGCELDKDYWETQEKRYVEYKMQPRLFEPVELKQGNLF